MLRCPDKQQVLRLHPATLSPEVQLDGGRLSEKSIEVDRWPASAAITASSMEVVESEGKLAGGPVHDAHGRGDTVCLLAGECGAAPQEGCRVVAQRKRPRGLAQADGRRRAVIKGTDREIGVHVVELDPPRREQVHLERDTLGRGAAIMFDLLPADDRARFAVILSAPAITRRPAGAPCRCSKPSLPKMDTSPPTCSSFAGRPLRSRRRSLPEMPRLPTFASPGPIPFKSRSAGLLTIAGPPSSVSPAGSPTRLSRCSLPLISTSPGRLVRPRGRPLRLRSTSLSSMKILTPWRSPSSATWGSPARLSRRGFPRASSHRLSPPPPASNSPLASTMTHLPPDPFRLAPRRLSGHGPGHGPGPTHPQFAVLIAVGR